MMGVYQSGLGPATDLLFRAVGMVRGVSVGQMERVLKHEQNTWALVQALVWCVLWNWDSVSSPVTERFILHGLLVPLTTVLRYPCDDPEQAT